MLKMPHEYVLGLTNAIIPSMRYGGSEDFTAWQDRCRVKLADLLGLPLETCDDDFTVEYEKDCGGYTDTRFIFQSEPGYYVPCHFLTPANMPSSGKLPVAICLQGHSKGMHLSLGYVRYPGEENAETNEIPRAVRAVKEGYCALALEQRNFGECGGSPEGPCCYEATGANLLIGRTTVGERVWDVMRAIDVIEKYFMQADMSKVICYGNSGGGTATFYSACMDSRIGYAMPSCSVCSFDHSIGAMRHCICNYIPGIRRYFDMGELSGLIAPRPLVIVTGGDDDTFPLSGAEKSYEEAVRLYKAAGAPDNVKLVVGNGGHRFYADEAWPVLNALIGNK